MMEDKNRMWKTLPVWFVVLLLIVGAVSVMGVWMLRIESPVTYDEPFTVEYRGELDEEDEWEEVTEFPDHIETDPIDLTYGTFHNYIRLTSEKRRPVSINATFSAGANGELQPEHIGFAFLEGVVDPHDVDWNSTGSLTVQGTQNNSSAEIEWGVLHENITLEREYPKEYTIITVLSNDAPLDTEENDLGINWALRRAEVTPGPVDVDVPVPLDRIYNFTPIIIIVSIIITALIGYAMYKEMEGVE